MTHGPDPPAAVYFYSPDRKAERPAAHLDRFRGILQVDGYAGFETLAASGEIDLAACWAPLPHARDVRRRLSPRWNCIRYDNPHRRCR